MTNYEKIKAMSIEELMCLINDLTLNCYNNNCSNCIFKYDCTPSDIEEWLESEVEEQ